MSIRTILSSNSKIRTLEYATHFFVLVKSGNYSSVVHGPYPKDDKRFSPPVVDTNK